MDRDSLVYLAYMPDYPSQAPDMTLLPVTRTRVTGLVIFGVILIVLIGLVYVFRQPVAHTYKELLSRTKLQGSYVVLSPRVGAPVQKIGISSVTPITIQAGKVLDYAGSANNPLGLVLSIDNRNEDVVALSSGTKITTDGGIKSQLAVSPDGTYVAYSQLIEKKGVQANSTAIDDWSVAIVNTKTNSTTGVSQAFGPSFISLGNKVYVAYMTTAGMDIFDPVDGTTVHAGTVTNTDVSHPTVVTPDGTQALVYNSVGNQYILYTIASSLTTNPKTMLSSAYTVVGATNEGFYIVPNTSKPMLGYVPFATPTAAEWQTDLPTGAPIKFIP